jgi:hypothetical protein
MGQSQFEEKPGSANEGRDLKRVDGFSEADGIGCCSAGTRRITSRIVTLVRSKPDGRCQ